MAPWAEQQFWASSCCGVGLGAWEACTGVDWWVPRQEVRWCASLLAHTAPHNARCLMPPDARLSVPHPLQELPDLILRPYRLTFGGIQQAWWVKQPMGCRGAVGRGRPRPNAGALHQRRAVPLRAQKQASLHQAARAA